MRGHLCQYPVSNSVSYEEHVCYHFLLKTGSSDNAIGEFSLAQPSWVTSHYTMLYKYGKHTRDFFGRFYCYFSLVLYILGGAFNKTIIPLTLVGYEMIIANARSWNNC